MRLWSVFEELPDRFAGMKIVADPADDELWQVLRASRKGVTTTIDRI